MKNIISNKYASYSMDNLAILRLDIRDNKATVEIKFSWQGFNLDTLKEESGESKRLVSLAKQNGIWKITQWKK